MRNSSIGITMGQASIAVGIILVILDAVLGERLGGTLCNMLFIGLFMDFLMRSNLERPVRVMASAFIFY